MPSVTPPVSHRIKTRTQVPNLHSTELSLMKIPQLVVKSSCTHDLNFQWDSRDITNHQTSHVNSKLIYPMSTQHLQVRVSYTSQTYNVQTLTHFLRQHLLWQILPGVQAKILVILNSSHLLIAFSQSISVSC